MNKTHISTQSIQVAIIGAGLGGLCLAQGLKQNGISFQVFEKDTSATSRTQGYRIRIDKTGQDAVAACLPPHLYSLFLKTSIASAGVRTLNSQLELLTDKWVDSWEDGLTDEQPDLKANRLTLREVLLTGLENHVHFNKKFIDYEKQADGRVCLYFEDGSSFIADVAIAADGVNSRLSAMRFPENKLTDTGSVCVYGKTYYTGQAVQQIAPVLQTDTAVIFEDEVAMIADAMQFAPAPPEAQLSFTDDYIYWALIGNRNKFGLDNEQALTFASGQVFNAVKKVTEAWVPSLGALFELANPESLTMVPVKTAVPQKAWSSDNITALGDSIHAMSPAGGLGANTALYDAALLTSFLVKTAAGEMDLLTAIARYEENMRQNSINAVRASQRGGEELYKQSTTD